MTIQQKKILVIEDETPVQKLLKRVIERLGYEVTISSDGNQALNVLSENSDDYILIITDLILPNMTGWEFLTHLKENALYDQIKTLVLSGVPASGEERSRLSELSDRVILKSDFCVNDFAEVLNELLYEEPIRD